MVADENGVEYTDNDERAIFYARGVLETVKKLRWCPDVIHCQGWMSAFVPLYIKKHIRTNRLSEILKLYSLYSEMILSRNFKAI